VIKINLGHFGVKKCLIASKHLLTGTVWSYKVLKKRKIWIKIHLTELEVVSRKKLVTEV